MAANTLYYGDNLDILRNSVDDESVDLVYLDPPFNSSRNYNVLFKRAKRDENQAQQVAFEDTWEWSTRRYEEFRNDPRNLILLPIMESLYGILSTSEMMAYLVMMAPRLVELKRVLKPTGSLYLHCDPVASHYLKILLDVIFAPLNFINEVTWKRTSSHNDARRKFGDVCDILLVYGRTSGYYFKPQYRPYDQGYLDSFYRYYDEDGRRYRLDNLRSPNPRPNLTYEYKGYQPHANGWAISREKMEKLDAEGRLAFPSSLEGRIQLKRYLDEMPGMPVGNLWDDIPPIHAHSAERMGYPTQKPLALLERILSASSREGDVVLDPFCGCGTATVAAERLGRKWIGIDITYIAIDLIMQRLSEEFALERGKQYRVIGAPQDAYAARKLFEESPKQFEVWAVANLANGIPQPEKSGDKGVDGKVYFDDLAGKLRYAVVQVKGGHLTPGIIRDFAHVIDREKAVMGYFICLETPTPGMYSTAEDAGMVTAPNGRLMPKMQILTVRELMDEGKLFDAPQGYTLKTGSRLLKRANEQGSLGI